MNQGAVSAPIDVLRSGALAHTYYTGYNQHEEAGQPERMCPMAKLRLHPQLKYSIQNVSYDPQHRVGRLDMRAGHCCNMSDCVEVFSRIDSRVGRIETYSGVHLDVVYTLTNGAWLATSNGSASL